jgi:hypothetical protein
MKIRNILRRIFLKSPLIPLLLFALLLFGFSKVYDRTQLRPVLEDVQPAAALPGEEITLTGNHFGEMSLENEVLIAGLRPVRSDYISWSNERIVLRVPDDAGSGRIFVRNGKGRSNGLLFTNRGHIPVVLEGPNEPGAPYIQSITPDSGAVGTELTLRGMNFGFDRQSSEVLFQFFSGAENESRDEDADISVACSELDFDYISWNDQELHIRVPDGASPGAVYVRTNRGESNGLYFEVTNPIGTKRYPRVKGYQIAYGVEISRVQSTGAASMEIWIPGLSKIPAQRNIESIHEPPPLWADYFGVMRYHLTDFDSWFTYQLEHTYWFDRYSIEADIHGRQMASYRKESLLYRKYTESSPLFPAEADSITQAAGRQAGRSASPYQGARAIYQYILEKLSLDLSGRANTVEDALQSGRGGSREYALSFVTLCRAAGIPARPVSGFIVYGDKQSRKHFWAEFYLESFGWVPVDPALGDGFPIGTVGGVENPREYYFGNLDNQHITMSKGVVEIKAVDPKARFVRYDDLYSIQTIHEEYSRSIERYRSVWKELDVIGWW